MSCGQQPEKILETLIFNDESRYAALGDEVESDTAAIFALTRDIWFAPNSSTFGSREAGFGIQEPGVFDCRVEPVLVGQITFRENPEDMSYVEGDDCWTDCCRCYTYSYRCTTSEVHAPCLLDSLADFADKKREDISRVFGNNTFDAVHLLSHRDFSGPTLGLAFYGAMCYYDAASIVQVIGSSIADTARILAHEIGHLFGMDHDPLDGDRTLMYPTFQSASANLSSVKFSKKSKDSAKKWMNNDYFQAGACLENEPSGPYVFGDDDDQLTDFNQEGVCGDGLVNNLTEECDVGLKEDDRCCGGPASAEFPCKLKNGCDCANGACCRNGTILPEMTVCRKKQHESCDLQEVCNGFSPECPIDLFESPGSPCVEALEHDGLCYKGVCKTLDAECADESEGQTPLACDTNTADALSFACSAVSCTNNTDRTSGCKTLTFEVTNGVPCSLTTSEKGQCSTNGEGSSECVDSDALKVYHWDESLCRCRDEAGNESDISMCDSFLRDCRSAHPTTSPYPTLSPYPSLKPTTLPPTPSPSS